MVFGVLGMYSFDIYLNSWQSYRTVNPFEMVIQHLRLEKVFFMNQNFKRIKTFINSALTTFLVPWEYTE